MTHLWSAPGRWIADQRGGGRAVRVSSHSAGGFVVLSTWQADTCVATVRLLPDEAAELVAGVAAALGDLVPTSGSTAADPDLHRRLTVVEQRVGVLETRG